MHTTLIQIGPFAIRSYGLMLALSFLFGILLARWRAKKVGLDFQRMIDLAVVVIIASILGSRAFYVLFHLNEFSDNPLDIINPFQSSGEVGIHGLSMYGGVILSILSGWWFLKRHRLPVWKVADVIAPSIALGIVLTRIGCFLNGCCFGKPGHLPWCIVFPSDSAAGYFFPETHIHPTQLYASAYGLLIFLALLFLERFKTFDGFTFWLFILLYAIARSSIDFVRYYEHAMTVHIGSLAISVNHIVSLGLFLTAIWMLIHLGRKRST